MKPLVSDWNLRPTSMALPSGFDGVPGKAVDGQIEHGHELGSGVGVIVGVAVEVGVGVGVPAVTPLSNVNRSKFVFQSFVVLTVTVEHVPLQPVAIACCASAASVAFTVGCPEQE